MILESTIAGLAQISGGIVEFYGLDGGMLPQNKKCKFPQYKMRAAEVTFFSGPKRIIEVFFFFFLSFFLRYESKVSHYWNESHDISGWIGQS